MGNCKIENGPETRIRDPVTVTHSGLTKADTFHDVKAGHKI